MPCLKVLKFHFFKNNKENKQNTILSKKFPPYLLSVITECIFHNLLSLPKHELIWCQYADNNANSFEFLVIISKKEMWGKKCITLNTFFPLVPIPKLPRFEILRITIIFSRFQSSSAGPRPDGIISNIPWILKLYDYHWQIVTVTMGWWTWSLLDQKWITTGRSAAWVLLPPCVALLQVVNWGAKGPKKVFFMLNVLLYWLVRNNFKHIGFFPKLASHWQCVPSYLDHWNSLLTAVPPSLGSLLSALYSVSIGYLFVCLFLKTYIWLCHLPFLHPHNKSTLMVFHDNDQSPGNS